MGTEASAAAIPAVAPARSGRFAINLVSNVGQLGLSIFIGAWYVPFLIRKLGPAAYGLIPLASTITSYMALITVGLNIAVGRSVTIALEQGDNTQANRIFNTSFWGSLALCAGLLLPAGLGLVFLDSIIRVPLGFEMEARRLFAAVVAAFLLNELRTPFAVSTYCRNRFDLYNIVATAEVLTRVGLVLVLFYAIAPRAEYVGDAILGGTVISAVGTVWLWRRLTPTLRIARRDFCLGALKSLTATGGWTIVNQLGSAIFMGIELLLANRLFGAELAGKYAAVLALPALIRTVAGTIGTVFSPTATYYYARGEIYGLIVYTRRAIKCVGLMLALPIGLICGLSRPLLSLWLGPAFGDLSPLLVLMTSHLCVNMAVNPLLGLQITTDRMKVPGVFTLFIGLVNVGLALLLAGPMQWGLYGIATAGAITMILKYALFTPLYVAHVLGGPRAIFLRELSPILLVTAVMTLLGSAVASVWGIAGWSDLIAVGLGISLLYCTGVYSLVLTQEERRMLRKVLRKD
jgi:membrane protein EpsK